jgi:hypothetical protein
MKTKYLAPKMVQVNVQIERMISESTTTQYVYTDDPQSTGNALVKKGNNYKVWDDDWSE